MRVYLDHNAGAPIRPQVRDALAAYVARDTHGNPSSIHRAGQYARRDLELARDRVAALIGAPARSIVFTSGGTEANNLALFGAAGAHPQRRRIVTTAIEHSSILTPLIELEARGCEVIRVQPDRDGRVNPIAVADAIDRDTALVSIGLANAEVGAIQTIAPIAEAANRAGAILHLDAAQAAGRISFNVDNLRCDLMTLSAHKLGGLAGSGALYVRPGARLSPTILGGPQEAGLRAGTPNLLGAIAFGIAAEVCGEMLVEEAARLAELSQQLFDRLSLAIPGLTLNGPSRDRLPNTLNLTFPDVLGETLLIALDLEGIEVSMGSACAAGAVEPSHVLLAMGRSAAAARSSLRLSLGWSTTATEVALAGDVIPRVWRRIAAPGSGASAATSLSAIPAPAEDLSLSRERSRSAPRDQGAGEFASRGQMGEGICLAPAQGAHQTASESATRGRNKIPRVLVAMSGGVDSSVAAALLHEQGYDVVGVAMRLTPDSTPSSAPRRGTCCSHDDFEDARRVAERMDFPFYVIDLRADFAARVINNFVSEYLNGRTPNPCVMCNREIKFDRLWDRARALQADFVATGHYARIDRASDGSYRLRRAMDLSKDQSYFLFSLGQKELARTLFPLGAMTKAEVRARARDLKLANADKPDSQEICFVPDGDYGRFVANNAAPTALHAGRIITDDGAELARHAGVHRFTVGQRRGLGVATGAPLYVRAIDAHTGDVTISPRDRLIATGLIATQVNLISPQSDDGFEAEVKIRYRHQGLPATIRLADPDRAEVRFRDGGPAVTPGQACVFYRDDEVLGGGFIERALEGHA